MTPDQFTIAVSGVSMRRRTRRALQMVLCEGASWRQAAKACDVQQSTILRAMRRVWSADAVRMRKVPKGAIPASLYPASMRASEKEIGAIVQPLANGKGRIIRRITSF